MQHSLATNTGSLHATWQAILEAVAGVSDAVREPADPAAAALYARYAPLLSVPPDRPLVYAHLAQSIDGRIALTTGCSQWLTGDEDLDHTHRLRALSDAVLVGASTVSLDDPLLTVRRVPGRSPLRVVLDPQRRLPGHHRVFTESSIPTLLLCREDAGGAKPGHAEVVGLPTGPGGWLSPHAILSALASRGVRRLFIEGGGVTVSRFLEVGLLDRLHLVVAPMVLGSGRPALQLPTIAALSDAWRPAVRVERLGPDTLFDCAFS